jgi:hypothetical protein
MAVPETKTAWEKFKEFLFLPVDKALLSAAPEIGHLTPVIAVVGTFFVALLTLNPSIALFGVGALEATWLHDILKTVGNYVATPFSGVETDVDPAKVAKCSSFFTTLTPSRFKLFMQEGLRITWPNSPLYYLSFFAAYCIQSMLLFNDETSNLGPSYYNRPYLASIAAALLLSIYLIYLLIYGCDSLFSMLFSIAFGIFVGLLICMQNNLLFGKQYVNVLHIPPIVRKSDMDYVCVATAK